MKRAKFWAKMHYGTLLVNLGMMFNRHSLITRGQEIQIKTLLESGWND